MRVESLEDRQLLSIDSPQVQLFNASPALFVENLGQWSDPAILYAFQGSGANVLHTQTGPVIQLFQRDDSGQTGSSSPPSDPFSRLTETDAPVVHSTQFSVYFAGANLVEPMGLDKGETVYNYFIGEQSNWRSAVPTFQKVGYLRLYDGIDLYTWGRRDSLKYEFRVAPGSDYGQIRVRYEGTEGLSVDPLGDLHVQTSLGELVDNAPHVYQEIGGRQIDVPARFELVDAQTFQFVLTGDYDPSAELVIDPDLAWSTYLGGSDQDSGYGIAVDTAGNALVTGFTFSSDWVSGECDPNYHGNYDAFVAKLSPTGEQLLWHTYLGGSGIDFGHNIAVDVAGDALVIGFTSSSGWVSGGFDTGYNGGYDAFVAKLSPTGDHLWSTYLGGTGNDWGRGIAVDAAGNVLVSGETYTAGWVSGGLDTGYDAFVVKLSPAGDNLLWSSFLGGNGEDHGYGIAVDASGNALVTGYTSSSGWVSGGFDTSYNGGYDAFVAKDRRIN